MRTVLLKLDESISRPVGDHYPVFQTAASTPWMRPRNMSSIQVGGEENKSTASDVPPFAIKLHLD